MDYERVLNTDYNFPNINIYNRISNGTHTGYQAIPKTGYVMYDTSDNPQKEFNPETGEYFDTIQYCDLAGFPLHYNFDNFSWVAVPTSEVKDYICDEDSNH